MNTPSNMNNQNNSHQVDSHASFISQNEQYFTFILAGEEYGVNILRVVEIRGWEQPTTLLSVPSFVKGIINLRGTIVPIIDLRERFGLPTLAYNQATVAIMLQVDLNGTQRVIGLVVDAVSDVYTISPQDIRPRPSVYSAVGYEYIAGLATVYLENKTNKLIIILDISKLLNFNEIANIKDQQ